MDATTIEAVREFLAGSATTSANLQPRQRVEANKKQNAPPILIDGANSDGNELRRAIV